MFDLDKYKNKTAVITDRNESLTYGQIAEEVENFAANYKDGFVFTLARTFLVLLSVMWLV